MSNTAKQPAVIGKRTDSEFPDLAEISRLAESAGYDVVGRITQTRPEDSAFGFGEGKVDELATLVTETAATVVIIDNRLGPYQTYNLANRLPDGTKVIDRFTLILEIFGQRASTKKAQLQVELAELRYELPRVDAKVSLAKRDEHPGFMGLGEYDESRRRDIKAQISRIQDELSDIATSEEHRRAERRASGFDLVALAGYTNAGKSTLLRQLARDLDVDANERLHPDIEPTAESADNLFTTLGTTTRRAKMDRNVLITDTVGFISELPHWLVESFRSTLESVYRADLVLLVVDVSEPVADIRSKLVTSHDVLYERNEAPILTVFNKADVIDEAELSDKIAYLEGIAPDPVAVSAQTGMNIDVLRDRIDQELPQLLNEQLLLPQDESTMSLISWLHDHTRVNSVNYNAESVKIDFDAPPSIVEQTRSKAAELIPVTDGG